MPVPFESNVTGSPTPRPEDGLPNGKDDEDVVDVTVFGVFEALVTSGVVWEVVEESTLELDVSKGAVVAVDIVFDDSDGDSLDEGNSVAELGKVTERVSTVDCVEATTDDTYLEPSGLVVSKLTTELVISVLSWAELEVDDSRFNRTDAVELDSPLEVTNALVKDDVKSLAVLADSEVDADDAKDDACEDSSSDDSDGESDVKSDVDDVEAEVCKDDANVDTEVDGAKAEVCEDDSGVDSDVDSGVDDVKAKVCEEDSSVDFDVDSEVDDSSVDSGVDSEVDDVKSEICEDDSIVDPNVDSVVNALDNTAVELLV
ncbi:uncharacterized protein AB675_5793 [Cyphellophora attinorum]|uniref:Uncharacterized protein n=1 Tax=Cyphellophora attinorum TaxID=1664694 RepID=A0A0N1NXQ2_9EURO|nr:uncharacterized protein AB675_5793 [Phialophora attinorum]KPI38854.1 hypothetical protein AB675_5793 [Phialophora attinorum]